MINKIYCYNKDNETIFRKDYASKVVDEAIREKVVESNNVNFFEIGRSKVIYKKVEELIVCFETEKENEIYILHLIDFLMNLLERLLGNLNEKVFIYNFKDVHYLIDNFILNGKVISTDPLEICASSYVID